jgi:hypothetical protein
MTGFDQQPRQSLAYRARRARQKDPAAHFRNFPIMIVSEH